MKSNKRISLVSLFVAAAFASSAAQADVVSNAFLGSVSYVLTDLDDTDGITSSINFSGLPDILIQGYALDEATSGTPVEYNSTTSQTGNANTAVSSASSTLTGTSGANGTSTSKGSTLSPAPGYIAGYSASTNVFGNFTLSANTEVTFTADATTFAQSTDAYLGGDSDSAFAYSLLSAVLYDIAFERDAAASKASNDDPIYTVDRASRRLSVTLRNTFLNTAEGYLLGYTVVDGIDRTNLSAVPVPAALPLMASALGLFGLGRRKYIA